MNSFWMRFLGLMTAAAGILSWADLRGHTSAVLLWAPKLLSSALTPWLALAGGLLAVMGLRRGDPLTAGASLAGAALSAGYAVRVAAPHAGFEQTFGRELPAWLASQARERTERPRWTPLAPTPAADKECDVPYGVHPQTGSLLLANLWQPPAGVARSGLGAIYVHGGAWRLGQRDMGTSWMFRRLASQGHVVMDIDYTLAPASDVTGMVQDVKRAVIWLKRNGARYGVDPARIVLIGASAGGHLALLAGYTPNDLAFQPDASASDTSVRGVVSFYGPADFLEMYQGVEFNRARIARRKHIRPYGMVVESLLQRAGLAPAGRPIEEAGNYIGDLLGADPEQEPDLYRQLSPVNRVGPHCPPTLLLQGTADIFGMGSSVRRLHQALQGAGVPSVLVEFPRTDHAFDLVLPQVSPAAQAALCDVERFLGLLTTDTIARP